MINLVTFAKQILTEQRLCFMVQASYWVKNDRTIEDPLQHVHDTNSLLDEITKGTTPIKESVLKQIRN